MDPYLESPAWFPDLHAGLIFLMKETLQQSLPAPYYAQSGQRVWLEYTNRYAEPDVEVVRSAGASRKRNRGTAVLAEARGPAPLVVTIETVEHGPFKENYLEIRARKGKEIRVVASIEVLSPSNKRVGHPSREKYLEKQQETLSSQTHLIEIDVLRGGTHTAAVPRDLVAAQAGHFDYLVSVHRFDRPKDFLVYPFTLANRLPAITIPLLTGDPDVSLDLAVIFERAYDAGPYAREIVYGKDKIVPRLKPDQARWVSSVLERSR
jgi:hypothetical protein